MNKIILLIFFFNFILGNNSLVSDLEKSLMAPCCWTGTVADHGNPNMEKSIKELVNKNMNKKEILDHFVNIYGERILAVPIARGFNLMAWIAPILILIIGCIILYNYIIVRTKISPKINFLDYKNVKNNDLIEKELKEME
tara:strand:- start:16775 stop:17194 length:420 start_codon:yes stop_codon:yes gene_type:complete